MSIDKFSRFIIADLDKADRLTPDSITKIVGDNFIDVALLGSLNKDVKITKALAPEAGGGNVAKGSLLPIRLKNGRLISAFTLRNLLILKTRVEAGKRMGKSGRLHNRTGRLLSSFMIEPQIAVVGNQVSLQFRYLFAPYEVFDPNADVDSGSDMKRSLATRRRSPRRLFTDSLRDVAREILWKGYDLTVKQVGVNKR